jgi:hypothetical protein
MRFKEILFGVFFLVPILLTNCNSEYSYDFSIQNDTEFQIDSFIFDCSFERKSIAIKPHERVDVKLTYEENITKFIITHIFTDAVLCYSVQNFSDSTNNYKNHYGRVLAKYSINLNGKNILKITPNQNPRDSTDVFQIKFIE